MLELYLDFEKIAPFLNTWILVVPGIVSVVVGIALWLAGSVKYRFIAAIVGCIALGVGASLMQIALVGVIVCCVVGLLAGGFFGKKAFLLASFVAAILVSFTLVYSFDTSSFASVDRFNQAPAEKLSPSESFKIVEDYSKYVGGQIKKTIKSLEKRHVAAILAAGIGAVIAELLLPRIIIAMTCGCLGVMLIAKGMILLLLYKGMAVITRVTENYNLYLLMAAGMIVFGTVIQLLLCPAKVGKKKIKEEKENGDKNDS